MRTALSITVVALLASCRANIPDGRFACTTDTDCPPGQHCNAGTCHATSGNDGGGMCVTDGDCGDGIFCNGMETCVGQTCQSGTPPMCPMGAACDPRSDSCPGGSVPIRFVNAVQGFDLIRFTTTGGSVELGYGETSAAITAPMGSADLSAVETLGSAELATDTQSIDAPSLAIFGRLGDDDGSYGFLIVPDDLGPTATEFRIVNLLQRGPSTAQFGYDSADASPPLLVDQGTASDATRLPPTPGGITYADRTAAPPDIVASFSQIPVSPGVFVVAGYLSAWLDSPEGPRAFQVGGTPGGPEMSDTLVHVLLSEDILEGGGRLEACFEATSRRVTVVNGQVSPALVIPADVGVADILVSTSGGDPCAFSDLSATVVADPGSRVLVVVAGHGGTYRATSLYAATFSGPRAPDVLTTIWMHEAPDYAASLHFTVAGVVLDELLPIGFSRFEAARAAFEASPEVVATPNGGMLNMRYMLDPADIVDQFFGVLGDSETTMVPPPLRIVRAPHGRAWSARPR